MSLRGGARFKQVGSKIFSAPTPQSMPESFFKISSAKGCDVEAHRIHLF